jgi:glycosyltransferase involved in cell wall biosynthesis
VVASAVGGLVDSVVDGLTGLHVPPRSPRDIAGAVRSLLDDPERRLDMGAAGARRVRMRYGWSKVAAATLDAYAQVERPWLQARTAAR